MEADKSDPEPPAGVPRRSTTSVESAFDWCFRDRTTGQIVIAQFPNIALGVFFAATAIGWFVEAETTASTALRWIAAAGLGWWAVDELVRGVNPWRRVLGVGGIVLTILAVARLLTGG